MDKDRLAAIQYAERFQVTPEVKELIEMAYYYGKRSGLRAAARAAENVPLNHKMGVDHRILKENIVSAIEERLGR